MTSAAVTGSLAASDDAPALLLVDDESNILKALTRLFRGSGYRIHSAENGFEALAILERESIDLIISDMRMPQMTGAEFLAQAAERWPDTMRILLTGFADIESTIAAVNQGKIYSYCSKPWNDNALKIEVRNALEQKAARDERTRLLQRIQEQNAQLQELNNQLESKVEQRTEQLRKSLRQIDHANKALKKQYTDSIKTFARIIEMRPGIKSGHAKYLAEHGRAVARLLELDENAVNHIIYAGLLLQIGKIGLPEDFLRQPLFELTQKQKNRYYRHAEEGQLLLRGIEQLSEAATIIHHQYEHYDGSGRPDNLVAAAIPIGARILAVIRDYIGLLDGSITGESLPTAMVRKHLVFQKERLYDPDVVDAFLSLLPEADPNEHPVIEISWTQVEAGMEVEEISCDGVLYLKDRVLTEKNIDDIFNLRANGRELTIKIRLGNG